MAKSSKKKPTAKKVTHLKGDTQMGKKNKEALKVIKSIKGMFG
ncbi:hypothetical protein [Cytobacillus oceanisediminis]|nr:hypothetical protein [Cytobacillus oceanisediminis]